MNNDNQFGSALDEQDDDQPADSEDGGDDLDRFLDAMAASGEKDKTVGVGVSEEMHYVYRELRNADEVDVDIPQSIRDQIERLARRHEDVADRARQKYELDQQ